MHLADARIIPPGPQGTESHPELTSQGFPSLSSLQTSCMFLHRGGVRRGMKKAVHQGGSSGPAHMLPFSPRRHQQPPWGHTWTKCSQCGSFQTHPTRHLSGRRVARRLRLWVLFPIGWVIWVTCVISASQFLSHEMNLLNQPVPKLFRGVKTALIFWSWLCLQLLIYRMGDSELLR